MQPKDTWIVQTGVSYGKIDRQHVKHTFWAFHATQTQLDSANWGLLGKDCQATLKTYILVIFLHPKTLG